MRTDGNIHCVKCNLEAWGKCPKCRTVFTEQRNDLTEQQKTCKHKWEYKVSQEKCIYGCGYISPLIYAGQF